MFLAVISKAGGIEAAYDAALQHGRAARPVEGEKPPAGYVVVEGWIPRDGYLLCETEAAAAAHAAEAAAAEAEAAADDAEARLAEARAAAEARHAAAIARAEAAAAALADLEPK